MFLLLIDVFFLFVSVLKYNFYPSFIIHSSYEKLQIRQKCKQYILKWDAVGSILKQTKRKHQLTIKTCIKYVDKNLQPKMYKSPVVAYM
jgi:hypothetical protein